MSVLSRFIIFWICIWDSQELLWALYLDALIDGKFPSVRYIILPKICMVSLTIDYFSVPWLTSSALLDAVLHPAMPSLGFYSAALLVLVLF